jgi:hypothetical protein
VGFWASGVGISCFILGRRTGLLFWYSVRQLYFALSFLFFLLNKDPFLMHAIDILPSIFIYHLKVPRPEMYNTAK